MKNPNLELQIDQLILEGILPHQKEQVVRALHNELETLFAQRGVPQALCNGGNIPRLKMEGSQRTLTGPSTEMGKQIAQLLYDGISNPPID